METFWSPRALDDVDTIAFAIESRSPEEAENFRNAIVATIESIPGDPHQGAMLPERPDRNLLQIRFLDFRIVYRIKPSRIEVVTVHSASEVHSDF